MNRFGHRLKYYRKMRGFSQTELAKHLSVGQATIANYESNKRFPNGQNLVKIASVLDVTSDVLLGLNNHLPTGPANLKTLNYAHFKLLILNHNFNEARHVAIAHVRNGKNVIEFYHEYIVKLLIDIGEMWQIGQMTVAEEHFISNEMLKLIHILSPFNQTHKTNGHNVLLMSLNEELHLIALRIIEEVFKSEGWTTYNIGNNVPWHDITTMIRDKSIDYLALSITTHININTINAFIDFIKSNVDVTIIAGGQAFENDNDFGRQINVEHIMMDTADLKYFITNATN